METLTKEEQITDFLSGLDTEVDIMNHITDYDIEDLNNLKGNYFYELYSILNNVDAFEVDIIYYHNAMDYLMKNDISLRDSIEIADNHGYETSSLNSELLASLLASQIARDDFHSKEGKINEFFNELNN